MGKPETLKFTLNFIGLKPIFRRHMIYSNQVRTFTEVTCDEILNVCLCLHFHRVCSEIILVLVFLYMQDTIGKAIAYTLFGLLSMQDLHFKLTSLRLSPISLPFSPHARPLREGQKCNIKPNTLMVKQFGLAYKWRLCFFPCYSSCFLSA